MQGKRSWSYNLINIIHTKCSKETQTKIQHEKESKKKRKKVSLVCSEFVKY
jgi:hypothetical protein